jgi:hypothetical protein
MGINFKKLEGNFCKLNIIFANKAWKNIYIILLSFFRIQSFNDIFLFEEFIVISTLLN